MRVLERGYFPCSHFPFSADTRALSSVSVKHPNHPLPLLSEPQPRPLYHFKRLRFHHPLISLSLSLNPPYKLKFSLSLSLSRHFSIVLGRVIVVRRSMAEHAGEQRESLIEKIVGDDSSSSSDSNDDKPSKVEEVQAKIFRLFGREKPIHKVLGGGKRNFRLFSRFKSTLIIIFNVNAFLCI